MLNKLYNEAEKYGAVIVERSFQNSKLKGLYVDDVITLNTAAITSHAEKICVLAEEIGHHLTSYGDILDQKNVVSRKQELRARAWSYGRLIPLPEIVRAYKSKAFGRFEVADFLNVTEEFLDRSIDHYREKYGLYAPCDNRYLIYFDPLRVIDLNGGQ